MTTLKTARLILRPWRDEDFEPFAKLNADPRVMEYFPALLSREESDQLIYRFQKILDEQGWGLWAASVPGIADFIGFIGLNTVTFTAPFTPAIEVGWRLAFPYWGKGYAYEACSGLIEYLFNEYQLKKLKAEVHFENIASIKLLEKLGFKRLYAINNSDDLYYELEK